MARTVLAVFDSKYVADKAVYDLRENGLASDRIDMFARPILKKGGEAEEQKHKKVRGEIYLNEQSAGLHIGAGIGSGVGLAAALLVTSGALSIPTLTAFMAGGALSGIGVFLGVIGLFAIAGGLFGSLLSSMIGLGISDEELHQYARNVRSDQIVVAVLADWGVVDPVLHILEKHNPLALEEKPFSQLKTGQKDSTSSVPKLS